MNIIQDDSKFIETSILCLSYYYYYQNFLVLSLIKDKHIIPYNNRVPLSDILQKIVRRRVNDVFQQELCRKPKRVHESVFN